MAPLPPPVNATTAAIYQAYEDDQRDQRRPHLGASQIGTDCERALWLSFRWASRARHTGRVLRLFETGEIEEKRLIANLRRIGVTVLDLDPATGRQWRVEALGGHLAGSMDAVAIGVLEAPKTYHVVEAKTHNIKSFKALDKGVQHSKPSHFYQCQLYMHLAGLERALYLAVCKDTDAIYQERIRYDEELSFRLVEKARHIIFSARPPVRISEDPASYLCRFCDHLPTCHEGKLPEHSCRTCISSTPLESGGWWCERWSEFLSFQDQKVGCPHYLTHPNLVTGEQVDAGEEWVEYRMPNGETWRDGFGLEQEEPAV